MIKVAITPGTMGMVVLAVDVVGIDHVSSGAWPGPVYLINLSRADAEAAMELIKEVVPEANFEQQ
jgi:hypothetical protein